MALPVIVVHGGCGNLSDNVSVRDRKQRGAEKGALAGWELLTGSSDSRTTSSTHSSCAALDAVEKAVRVLEDDPEFNAGRGSMLTRDGLVEMDAVIMDGRDLNAGAVACVSTVANPVTLARYVMEKSDHVLLVADGAEKFANEVGIPIASRTELITEEARSRLMAATDFSNAARQHLSSVEPGHGTVGAVAVDRDGNLAAATSTGGMTGKLPGRVGDSPLVGSGAYADNSVGAASATGSGEHIMRMNLSRLALWHIEGGKAPQEAVREVVENMETRVHGSGGLIVVDKGGKIGIHTSTRDIVWASCSQSEGLRSGLKALTK
ncbi:isoaspartyl peptidase/L-asparaginase-like [Corticium candelabrum]|uniref:isoaspartyl peptidase/L-asparaginase-like n=1 Tax=Corticium candelabrum TaxID=121492 RepID=UPI002E27678B|nr:isoaspartyl peptidase/L-asparaginase-like [Corticium candelabrum]